MSGATQISIEKNADFSMRKFVSLFYIPFLIIITGIIRMTENKF